METDVFKTWLPRGVTSSPEGPGSDSPLAPPLSSPPPHTPTLLPRTVASALSTSCEFGWDCFSLWGRKCCWISEVSPAAAVTTTGWRGAQWDYKGLGIGRVGVIREWQVPPAAFSSALMKEGSLRNPTPSQHPQETLPRGPESWVLSLDHRALCLNW